MPHVESIGGKVYYEVAGEGPSLVFLHGQSMDRRMWAEQVRHFARCWRCILVDRRGHGYSDPPGDGWSVMADLAAVLDDAEAGYACFVGQSQGGWDAVCFALEAPRRVRALALVDAFAPVPAAAAWQGYANAKAAARTQGPEAANAIWLQDAIFQPAMERPALAERLRSIVAEHTWITERKRVSRGPEPAVPYMERLAETAAPSLVLCGERDLPAFQEMAQTYQRTLPRAEPGGIAWVPAAGHMANMEEPAAVNGLLERFLAKHRAQ